MSVYRVHKTQNYTVMSNSHLRDNELSLKAKGLLSVMLSLPDDWDYSIKGLCSISFESEKAIKSALAELRRAGYLIVTKKMPNETESHRIEYQYDIYEEKRQGYHFQPVEHQPVEHQPVEHQPVEKDRQINTEKLNTEKQNTKRKSTDFQPPTLEEVQAYCKERNSTVDARHFYEYFSVGEWKDSKGNPVKNWKQKLLTWERMNNGSQRVCRESQTDKTDRAVYQQNFVIEANRPREITYDHELYGD